VQFQNLTSLFDLWFHVVPTWTGTFSRRSEPCYIRSKAVWVEVKTGHISYVTGGENLHRQRRQWHKGWMPCD